MHVTHPLHLTTRGRPTAVDSPDVKFRAFVTAAQGAFSENTKRALRSDLGIFAAWCERRGVEPVPAAPRTVVAFIDHMAEVRAPATVRRYVTSIRIAH